ncbi:exoribonuclease R [Escherichia coli]|uniref:Exoribonuclease R n=1 Tax=Escherichia coli TaxID=562 RepID=A0A376TMC7_ECOLX|nr:exoribonuclease R [Escherichia coli]
MVVVELTQRPTRRTKAVGKSSKCWATIWAPAWRLISLCVPMKFRTSGRRAVEQQVAGLKEEVPEEAKRAVSICAIYRWSPLMAKTPVTLTMQFTARKNAAAAGRLWVAIADVSYYVRRQRRWTEKRVTVYVGVLPFAGYPDAAGSAL